MGLRGSGSLAGMSFSPPLARYVADAKAPHRELQRALTQLSAFLLKRLTGRTGGTIDYGPVEAARTALSECGRMLQHIGAPAGAAHHRRHLDIAHAALCRAVSIVLGRRGFDEDAFFGALERAERDLKALWRIVPGFEPVDFSQACCAQHGLLVRPEAAASPA